MSNRCYLCITCRASDFEEHFKPNGFKLDEEVSDDVVIVVKQEALYNETLPRSIPYYGYHGEGDDGGAPMEIACDGNGAPVFVAAGEEGGFVVEFNDDGEPDPRDMRDIRDFLKLRKRAKAMLERTPLQVAVEKAIKRPLDTTATPS